jgi:hypothetical protein
MGDKVAASEDIERHVVRKFEICQRLGKGVKRQLLFITVQRQSCNFLDL